MKSSGLLAYIHIPKTGGNTVDLLLRRSFGTRYCYTLPLSRTHTSAYRIEHLRRQQLIYPRLQCIGGHFIKRWADLEHFFKGRSVYYFTFLRDPVTRAVSQYLQFKRTGRFKRLGDYLRAPELRNRQLYYLSEERNLDEAIDVISRPEFLMVGLVERFDESLLLLRRKFAEGPIDVRYSAPLNPSAFESEKRAIMTDQRILDDIAEINQKDLELYRQVKNQHFPSLLAEYGPGLSSDLAAFEQEKAQLSPNLNEALFWLKANIVYRPYSKLRSGRPIRLRHLRRRLRLSDETDR